MTKTKVQELSTEKLNEIVEFMVNIGIDIDTLMEGSIAKQHLDELKLRENGK